jgi:hypothetical protein
MQLLSKPFVLSAYLAHVQTFIMSPFRLNWMTGFDFPFLLPIVLPVFMRAILFFGFLWHMSPSPILRYFACSNYVIHILFYSTQPQII